MSLWKVRTWVRDTLIRPVEGVREVRARLRPVRRTSAVAATGPAAGPMMGPVVGPAAGPAAGRVREAPATTAEDRGQHAVRAWARSHRA